MAFPLDPNGQRCELSDPRPSNGGDLVSCWLPAPGPTVPSHLTGRRLSRCAAAEAKPGLSRSCSGVQRGAGHGESCFFDTPWVCTHPWSHCLSTPDTRGKGCSGSGFQGCADKNSSPHGQPLPLWTPRPSTGSSPGCSAAAVKQASLPVSWEDYEEPGGAGSSKYQVPTVRGAGVPLPVRWVRETTWPSKSDLCGDVLYDGSCASETVVQPLTC